VKKGQKMMDKKELDSLEKGLERREK
jgi:hypothetical protein